MKRERERETLPSRRTDMAVRTHEKKPRHQEVPPTSSHVQVEMAAAVTSTSRESGHQGLISNLPDECITLIFSFLPSPRDRCSCAAVSRKWLLLQAFMRPSNFLPSLSTAPLSSSLTEDVKDDDDQREGERRSRFLNFLGASDARLAAMAVGACNQGALTELIIRADFFRPPNGSPLLRVTDMGLKIISQTYPKLRQITFLGCDMVGSEGLAAIAHGCPALEKLYISSAPLLDDAGLALVARNCPKLSSLSLNTCPLVGDGALHAFARCSSNLESLSLDNCPLMSDAGLAAVFSFAPRLARLTIAFMKVEDAALEAVVARGAGENPILSLTLESVWGFTPRGFRRVGLAPNLQSLTVRCCAGLDDEAFASGGQLFAEAIFVRLRRVAVRNCEAFSDAGLMQLSESARHVENLRLEKCHRVTTRGLAAAVRNWSGSLKLLSLVQCNGVGALPERQQQEQEQGALFPNRCPHIKFLAIKKCPRVEDAFLSLLGRALVRARHVEVVGMRSVTDRGFVSLLTSMDRRDALRTVDMSGCGRITDWSVVALVSASGEALRRLTLRGCRHVTDRSLQVIGQLCPALEELDLTGCRRVGDAGVAGLADPRGGGGGAASEGVGGVGRSHVEMLSLEGCEGITDESLRSLGYMAVHGSLEWVNLKGCAGLSPAAVDVAREAFWWCDFVR